MGASSSKSKEEEERERRLQEQRILIEQERVRQQIRLREQYERQERERQLERLRQQELQRQRDEQQQRMLRLRRENELRQQRTYLNSLKKYKVSKNLSLINCLRGSFGLHQLMEFPTATYTETDLSDSTYEYRQIHAVFKKTNKPFFTVTRIVKVDNTFLCLHYFVAMKKFRENEDEDITERIVFHGTKCQFLECICSLNFKRSKLQINLQASQPQQHSLNDTNGSSPSPLEDDIDAALNNLQTTLEGSSISTHSNDITSVPELKDQLRFLKPKRFTLKAYKKYWFTCRDLHLYMFKTREDMVHNSERVMDINLKGCEVTPDVNISQNKYVIKLEVPSADGMTEMYIRCDDETQYSRWMACCRLAAKGRSLADSSYETEKQTILDFLSLQRRAEQPVLSPNSLDIQVEDYISPKYLKKSRGKLTQRILEAHTNVKDLSLINAKLNYIKAWQLLPDFGITLFAVKFMNSKKEELLGVAYNRIMKMDINSGDHQKTWRYNTMKAWNVNWEIKHMMVQFEEENIVFSCLSADCKVVHEFIGGYIFLSTRSKDASQTLNEELFHKLTGGWS